MPLKALILIGGFGSRLRPLTFTKAKPLVPFVNKPILIHQIEALKAAGVTEVILAIGYKPEPIVAELAEWGAKLGIKFIYTVEETPLGTAGPLALSKQALLEGAKDDEPFFVLNADVTCEFPFVELLAAHKKHGKEGTLVVTQVKDPSAFGVVVYDKDSKKIERFVEKPKEFVGDRINAGLYIFNRTILDRIPPERMMIETQVFPNMAKEGQLYAFELQGFWADIGQPHEYLIGLHKFLPSYAKRSKQNCVDPEDAKKAGFFVEGHVVVDPTAKIAAGAHLGPNVTVGANCKVGPYARLHNCAIFENTTVGAAAFVSDSIIGWANRIGDWCRVEKGCVFGDDVGIKAEVHLSDVKVCPNKDVKESCSGKIILG